MKLKSILAIGAIMLAGTACNPATILGNIKGEKPSKTRVERSYSFENIKGIDTSSGIIVHYTQQPSTQPVTVEGPENVVAAFEINFTKNGVLDLSMDSGKSFRYKSEEDHVNVWVAAPAVSSLEASSGGSIIVNEPITATEPIEINASSGAGIYVAQLNAVTANIKTSSGADVEIYSIKITDSLSAGASSGAVIEIGAGTAENAYFKASSGASVRASGMTAQRGECKASSGGGIKSSIKQPSIKTSSGGSVINKD